VNASEGEPASAKDAALVLTRPHLVLDGAVATAHALGARDLHVVLPGERPEVAAALRAALADRDDGLRVHEHVAANRFVAGQARAGLELMAGRPGYPVTAWQPEAVQGHRGRPTLLSNAETWAQVGHLLHEGEAGYRRHGTAREPGTTLLTLGLRDRRPVVREAAYGARVRDLLADEAHGRPALIGGFHGSWVTWTTLASLRLSVDGLRALGTPLGAGVVFTPGAYECPVRLTSRIVDYLAGQSARRCGPCLNGLPALATAVRAVADGSGGTDRVTELAGLVERRGACAHPDGTVRLVRSLLVAMPDEVDLHLRGGCGHARRARAGEPPRRLRAVPDWEGEAS
jgi:NADH:ubiquinone oxidoreductase subunit F (NADH-binding)